MAEVAQFCEITGATAEQAAFFLSMSGNNLDNAVSSFFENDGGMGAGAMQGVEDASEVVATSAPVRDFHSRRFPRHTECHQRTLT